MIRNNLARLLFTAFLAFFTLSAPAASAETGTILRKLHDMRLETLGILSDYFMFSGLEGDSKYSRQMENGIKGFESNLADITRNNAMDASLPSTAAVIQSWQDFKKLLDTNRADFMVRGYADTRLVDELSKNAISLSKALEKAYENEKTSKKFNVSEWTENCREMAIIIQTITAEYSARSTSNLGQVFMGNISEGGMDKQAERFNVLLAKVQKAPAGDANISKLLDQVLVKWEFISRSIKNYNENAVPFIVNTYGERIATNLETIGDFYNQSVQAKR